MYVDFVFYYVELVVRCLFFFDVVFGWWVVVSVEVVDVVLGSIVCCVWLLEELVFKVVVVMFIGVFFGCFVC